MRVLQIYVRDSTSVKQYAYCEEINQPSRQQMEDNYVAEDNIVEGAGLFAVFDGHGGAQVSDFCAQNLPTIFRQEYDKESEDIQLLFTRICQRIDVEVASLKSQQTGSTCCLVLVRQRNNKRTCHVANLGDTRAIICTDKQIAKRVTVDHKASNPSEVDRVTKEGGHIFKGRVEGMLAITRALGDLQLKSSGVSNVPDYQQLKLDGQILYMIIASDGLWDVCEDQQAIQLCQECSNPKEIAKTLMTHALSSGTRDNTSIMVLQFM